MDGNIGVKIYTDGNTHSGDDDSVNIADSNNGNFINNPEFDYQPTSNCLVIIIMVFLISSLFKQSMRFLCRMKPKMNSRDGAAVTLVLVLGWYVFIRRGRDN